MKNLPIGSIVNKVGSALLLKQVLDTPLSAISNKYKVINEDKIDTYEFVKTAKGNYIPAVNYRIMFHNIFEGEYEIVEDLDSFNPHYQIPNLGTHFKKLDNKTCVICNHKKHVLNDEHGSFIGAEHRFEYIFLGANCHYWMNYYDRRYGKHLSDINKIYKEKSIIEVYTTLCNSELKVVKSINEIIMNIYQKRELINKIDNFYHSYNIYNKMNIPYKLGILLYGRPGTGKSALANAIAVKYGVSVDIINGDRILKCIEREQNPKFILSLSRHTKSKIKRVILFEEIDGLLEAKKDKGYGSLRRDQVIKFIDDLPAGSIVIATTNHIEKIDPAIIRTGRFDIKIEMEAFEKPEAIEMIRLYGLDESFADKFSYPIIPADLQFAITQEIRNNVIN